MEAGPDLERTLGGRVAGIDEAGRGPWAGPVVAAAVILDYARIPPGIDDSKRLTARRRAALFEALIAVAEVGIGRASVEEIDAMNIAQATALAMRRAVAELPAPPDFALVDGRHVPPGLPCRARALVGGDGRSLAVAAASIVAKVTRDRIMAELAREWPGYGWERNAGYGVPEHAAALARLGVSPHHRRSFRPVHKILCQYRPITA
ncbi:MAG: ribonuclease HII [Alphaproteobacteria bacterium]|nr:MAG: ribonuclease HII [Alphaproteobacteria bacterium]